MNDHNWTPYPKADGEYLELFGLVLTAWPTGAWSVHDPKHRVPSRSSVLASVLYADMPRDEVFQQAREQAIMAATAMRPYEPTPLPDGF